MKNKYYFIFFLTILPDILFGILFLLLYMIAGKSIQWDHGLVVTIDRDSWFRRCIIGRFNGGALAHHVWVLDGAPGRVMRHEKIHVEQFEVAIIMGLVCGAVSLDLITFLILWVLSSPLLVISGWFVAWIRGEDIYRGSMHEESAYALED